MSHFYMKKKFGVFYHQTIEHGIGIYHERKTNRILTKTLATYISGHLKKSSIENSLTKMTMNELNFIFMFYLLGAAVSMLIFFIEVLSKIKANEIINKIKIWFAALKTTFKRL